MEKETNIYSFRWIKYQEFLDNWNHNTFNYKDPRDVFNIIFNSLNNENNYCIFAEWFHRHALDDKNGGYYMHFNSGMEVNKPYNILEIYTFFNDNYNK